MYPPRAYCRSDRPEAQLAFLCPSRFSLGSGIAEVRVVATTLVALVDTTKVQNLWLKWWILEWYNIECMDDLPCFWRVAYSDYDRANTRCPCLVSCSKAHWGQSSFMVWSSLLCFLDALEVELEEELAICILKEQRFVRGLFMRLISKVISLPKNAEGFRIQQVQTTIATIILYQSDNNAQHARVRDTAD